MSSNTPHDYPETSHIQMLDRVLERAGFFGPESKVDVGVAREAVQYLLKLFQGGIDAEEYLVAPLNARANVMQMGAILRGKCDWKQSIDGPMTEVGVAIRKLAIKSLMELISVRAVIFARSAKAWYTQGYFITLAPAETNGRGF